MRLGSPVENKDPESWLAAIKQHGYRAAYCPVKADTPPDVAAAYLKGARDADVVMAEVGAWSNPMSPNDEERKKAIAHCQSQLALAERVGARCCVNIAGSRGEKWDGPHASHYTTEVFDMIVATTREIIDAVKPKRTFYTLETMPWCPPDSVASYAQLVRAIDRPGFAVHFDPVNLISSPQLFYSNGRIIRDFIEQLGGHIKSVHAKDIILRSTLTVHLDEARPGLGGLDYRALLTGLNRLDKDLPVMLEHLSSPEEYLAAAAHVRAVAAELSLKV